jgi:hypothetical protein
MQMRSFLNHSISSINRNKLNGLLAEIDFRQYLISKGFEGRVSPGGWIVRCVGQDFFGHNTVVFFPELIEVNKSYPSGRVLPEPPHGLHTICATFHQIGIASYYCAPEISFDDGILNTRWQAVQLGLPVRDSYKPFPGLVQGFFKRKHRYNFLKYHQDVSAIPEGAVPEEFSKENIRIAFQNEFIVEISDVDGILWGKQYTYPVEIKEKTAATDKRVGNYFGIDVGPFVKLAYYAAKKGNLHSLFVVREISDVDSRQLVNWWAIKFDQMAQFASWNPRGGGKSMIGGTSSVVKIPKCEFSELNREFLDTL